MQAGPRYRLDDLRRLASALGAGVGLARPRAAALASQLLWFDAAGASEFGIATLPDWLDRIQRGDVDPKADGRIRGEHAGTAMLDGQGGVPPLILSRAAALAGEKAREVGVGAIRVSHLGPMGPTAAVAAELAIGPLVAAILGPGPSWTLALPSAEGLPVVFDSALAHAEAPPAAIASLVGPWALLVPPSGGWLLLAIALPALEPPASFQERLTAALDGREDAPGLLLPRRWEAQRSEARQHGILLGESTLGALSQWAARLGISRDSLAPLVG